MIQCKKKKRLTTLKRSRGERKQAERGGWMEEKERKD